MRILFLTTILLSKSCNGGEVASQCFIDSLRELGHKVLVLGYLRKGDFIEQNPQEVLVVEERYTETNKSKIYSILWLLLSLVKNIAYSSAKYYSKEYIKRVKELLDNDPYDVIIIDHSQIAWLEIYIKEKHKIVAIAHNVEHEIYQANSRNVRNLLLKFIYRRESHLIKTHEDTLAVKVKQVWTLTQHDACYFSTLKNATQIKTFPLAPGSKTLLERQSAKNFDVGLLASWTWKANEEGLKWFLQAVYPYLPSSLSIHIAGKGADWVTSKYSNVLYQGIVPDAQEFMSQAKVVAIPILSGSGIQIKTLDAIASGSAIVATSIALRGISDPPRTIQVSDHPQAFASHLVAAITSIFSQEDYNDTRTIYYNRRNTFVDNLNSAISKM